MSADLTVPMHRTYDAAAGFQFMATHRVLLSEQTKTKIGYSARADI